jgi:hypothetical protein
LELLVLFDDKYTITGVSKDGECDAINTLIEAGEEGQYQASVDGLMDLLDRVSKDGLINLSSKLTHFVDQDEKIYEFVKGDLRLFYFKGEGDFLVICTSATIKKTQKADRKHVMRAIKYKNEYLKSVQNGTLKVVEDN